MCSRQTGNSIATPGLKLANLLQLCVSVQILLFVVASALRILFQAAYFFFLILEAVA